MHTRWLIFAFLLTAFSFGCQQEEKPNYEQEEFSEYTTGILQDLKARQATSGQFRIYYPKGSIAEKNLKAIFEEVELSKLKSMSLLGEASYEKSINLLLVDSQEKLNEIAGLNEPEVTNPVDRFAIVVYDDRESPAFFTRSIFKILSVDAWGKPGDPILFEGAAAFAQGYCQGVEDPINAIPAQAIREKKICSLRGLLFNFKECWGTYPVTSRMQAASIFQMLFDGFDKKVTRRIWKQGLANIEGAVGMSPTDLNLEWEYRMKNVTPQEIDLDAINAAGCR